MPHTAFKHSASRTKAMTPKRAKSKVLNLFFFFLPLKKFWFFPFPFFFLFFFIFPKSFIFNTISVHILAILCSIILKTLLPLNSFDRGTFSDQLYVLFMIDLPYQGNVYCTFILVSFICLPKLFFSTTPFLSTGFFSQCTRFTNKTKKFTFISTPRQLEPGLENRINPTRLYLRVYLFFLLLLLIKLLLNTPFTYVYWYVIYEYQPV